MKKVGYSAWFYMYRIALEEWPQILVIFERLTMELAATVLVNPGFVDYSSVTVLMQLQTDLNLSLTISEFSTRKGEWDCEGVFPPFSRSSFDDEW